jgi:hypothetical protein
MEVGCIYKYCGAAAQMQGDSYVMVFSSYEWQTANANKTGNTVVIEAINLQDSSDFRRIPDYYWKYWQKVE